MPPGQAGQSSTPAQPLPMRPQYWPPPAGLQVIGVQFVAVQTPGHATAAAGRAGGAVAARQRAAAAVADRAAVARASPDVQVSGTQLALAQTPALQTWPVGQAPHSSFDPQPSPTVPQYRADPAVHATRWQLDPPMQRPAVQTPSPAQGPHSSEPPLQPLPILPQYWPPGGVQIVDGVQAASLLLPASIEIEMVPPVPVVALVPPILRCRRGRLRRPSPLPLATRAAGRRLDPCRATQRDRQRRAEGKTSQSCGQADLHDPWVVGGPENSSVPGADP